MITIFTDNEWEEEKARQMVADIWERFCDNIPYLLNQGITLLIIGFATGFVLRLIWGILESIDDKGIIDFPHFIINLNFAVRIHAVIIAIVIFLATKNNFILFSIF